MTDAVSMLTWVSADQGVASVEQESNRAGLTLGPAASWAAHLSVREMVAQRAAWRLNPVIGHIEDLVGGFGYGVGARTLSAPREACGPELRQALFAAPERIREVELRLLPMDSLHWLKVAGKDAGHVHGFVRRLLREGVFPRAVWTELGTAYVCFAMQTAAMFARHSTRVATALQLSVSDAQEPGIRAILAQRSAMSGLKTKTWESLGALDSIALADPWTVLCL